MGSKNDPGEFDCYANALPDEPMFILLGRDPSAPDLVNDWADCRESEIGNGKRPQSDRPMVEEARQCATNMRLWRRRNDGAWRNRQPPSDIEQARAAAQAAMDYADVNLTKMEAADCPTEGAQKVYDAAKALVEILGQP